MLRPTTHSVRNPTLHPGERSICRGSTVPAGVFLTLPPPPPRHLTSSILPWSVKPPQQNKITASMREGDAFASMPVIRSKFSWKNSHAKSCPSFPEEETLQEVIDEYGEQHEGRTGEAGGNGARNGGRNGGGALGGEPRYY